MTTPEKVKSDWLNLGNWFASSADKEKIEAQLVTNVPIELAVQKLRGFIADRQARILKAAKNTLRLEVSDKPISGADDRPLSFLIDMHLSEEHVERTNTSGLAAGRYVQTRIDIVIQTKRTSKRRQDKIVERARLMLGSVKSYLMAKEVDEESAPA